MAHQLDVCEHCGYELAGLGVDRCPECGADIRARAAFAPAPWPPWWAVLGRMCWPCAAVSAAMAVLARVLAEFPGALSWLVVAWPVVLVLWVTVAITPPLSVAADIAARCELRPRRPRIRWVLTGAGFAANLVATWVIASIAAVL